MCGTVCDAVRFSAHCHACQIETSGEWVAFDISQMLDYQRLSFYQSLSIYQYISQMLIIMHHRVCKNPSAA